MKQLISLLFCISFVPAFQAQLVASADFSSFNVYRFGYLSKPIKWFIYFRDEKPNFEQHNVGIS